jgi:hypothetical protein
MRRDSFPPDRILLNGVVVKGCLRINEFTLREHRDHIDRGIPGGPMKRKEALQAGYSADEVEREFGPA